ncbi:MAG: leucine-rich repeat protein [Treponematales bacterium]
MLTADTSALEGSGTISYQWKKADTSGGEYSDIENAASSTYTLASADGSKFLKVAVTRAGYSGSKESEAKGPVAAVSVTTTAANLASVLAGLAANTADTPYTISLAAGTSISDNWTTINTAVTGRYVILDLSACAATDNTIAGEENATGNYPNVIRNNAYITGVILPDTLTSVRASAFALCAALTSVTIPDSVTSIGDFAFEGCSSLTSVIIPAAVTSIGISFHDTGLTSVTFGGSTAIKSTGAFPSGASLLDAYRVGRAGTYT